MGDDHASSRNCHAAVVRIGWHRPYPWVVDRRKAPGGCVADLLVIGAGGHGRVVASVAEASGRRVVGFVDDDASLVGRSIDGIPVLGGTWEAAAIIAQHAAPTQAVIGVGDNRVREALANRLSLPWATLMHPFSWVHHSATLGPGTVVCAGTIIQPGARIGRHVILNTSTGIEHDCVVGDHAHLAVTHLAGAVMVGEGAFLGVGAKVVPRVRIGAWATVGAGAVVIRDVPPGVTVVGVPAAQRPVRV